MFPSHDPSFNSLATKRVYPRFIKATQTYGPFSNLVEVLYFSDVLKDLGINTQFVHAFYWYRGGEFKLWYDQFDKPKTLSQDEARRALVYNILLAKQQGLAVILFPDYFQLEDGGMAELGIDDDLETHLEGIALDLAEIAERYDVEYFVPVNQIEMILDSNGFETAEAQARTNAFYTNVVPKVRQVYSGKIMYKMGGFGDWGNYDQISLAGADIFGFTGCYNSNRDSLERVTQDIKESSVQANRLSQQYGIPWINAEFVASDENLESTSSNDQPVTPASLEEYYRTGLAAF